MAWFPRLPLAKTTMAAIASLEAYLSRPVNVIVFFAARYLLIFGMVLSFWLLVHSA
jgi:hypothetical protein